MEWEKEENQLRDNRSTESPKGHLAKRKRERYQGYDHCREKAAQNYLQIRFRVSIAPRKGAVASTAPPAPHERRK